MIIGHREISCVIGINTHLATSMQKCSKLHVVCDVECKLATNCTLGAKKIMKVPNLVEDLRKQHGEASYKHMEVPTMQRVKTDCIMSFPAL